MARQKPIEIINPPNVLKAKIGGPMPPLDQKAIARAEQALARLSVQFNDWIVEEMDRLTEAWAAYESGGPTLANREQLHRRAHDLKGLAPTYGYPLVGRICASLCKLTGDEGKAVEAPMSILKAHVDGVKAAVRGRIMTPDHPVGLALANELESRMRALLGLDDPSGAPPAAQG